MSIKGVNLHEKHDKMLQLREQTYGSMYKDFARTILQASRRGDEQCSWDIPNLYFKAGYPEIDTIHCANFLMNKAAKENSDIHCTFVHPNKIYADWRR